MRRLFQLIAPALLAAVVLIGAGGSGGTFFGMTIGSVGSAQAQTPEPTAQQLADKARRAHDLGRLDEAIEAYARAYQMEGDPNLLFTMGEAHREAGHDAEALRTFRNYMRRDPQGVHRESAERQIKELEQKARRAGAGAGKAAVVPPPPIAVPVVPPPLTPPSAAPRPPAPPPAPPVALRPPPPAPTGPAALAVPPPLVPIPVRPIPSTPAPVAMPAPPSAPPRMASPPPAPSTPPRPALPAAPPKPAPLSSPRPSPPAPLPAPVASPAERPSLAPPPLATTAATSVAQSPAPAGVDLTTAPSASEQVGPPVPRWVPWALAATSVALGTSAIISGLSASDRFNALKDSCGQTPQGCEAEPIDDVRSRARRTNILWALTGVAAAATGVTVYVNTSAVGVSGLWPY